MFRLPKSVLSIAASALALGLLIVAAPRAAHAIAASLVEVTNTTAYPVITQSTNLQASQIVELMVPQGAEINQSSGLVAMRQFSLPAGPASAPYTVPAGQNLVITGVELDVESATYFSIYLPWGGGNFGISNAQLPVGFQQIKYPSGIVVPAGSLVYCGTLYGGSVGDVLIHGYLTAN